MEEITSLLDDIAASLTAYRGKGQELILFDGRDRGNYGDYEANRTNEMFRKHDPTGLAEALLLNEKIEATIECSKVKLSRVLREPGYLTALNHILELKTDLLFRIAEPMKALTDYLDSCLQKISMEFRKPTSKEIALCLRDAIYCMDTGMRLRWLSCDNSKMPSHLPLCPAIGNYSNITEFTDVLRTSLPFGAHLARIGREGTAIGLKYPGKIAFLSSMTIDTWTGYMTEKTVNGGHLAEEFDIDHATARYPQWIETQNLPRGREGGTEVIKIGENTHGLNHISKLPIDRLIWLAMMVEMAGQKMAATEPSSAQLAESITRALPEYAANNLPMVISPNWVAAELTLEKMFDSLGFSDWERKFLWPALDGLTANTFMPEDGGRALRLDTKKLVDWPVDSKFGYSEAQEIKANAIRLIRISSNWVGSKEETDNARRTIFGRNLVSWLMEWGNREFIKQSGDMTKWYEKRLRKNIEKALQHSCVVTKGPECLTDFRRGVLLYANNPNRKGFSPRCFFHERSEVSQVAHIFPQSAGDLVDILGLKNEKVLPEFLHGWQREIGWSTDMHHKNAPYGTTEQWCFSKELYRNAGRNSDLEAVVCLGMARMIGRELYE